MIIDTLIRSVTNIVEINDNESNLQIIHSNEMNFTSKFKILIK
jgi:hypothetical protein